MKDGGKTFRGTLNPLARRALAFAVMYVYFEYWDYKSKIRQSLNIGALAIFSISGLVMAFDIGGEIAGTNRIKILFSTVDAHPHLKLGLQLLFVAAACYGVIHHLLEMRKPGYEFNCMQVLCDLMENQRAPVSRPLFDVLSLCHTVFERAGIFHVAVALPPETPCEKIVLTIDPKHVYPPENSEAFYIPLPLEASVAGKVARDSKSRYVPRLYFPFGKKRKHIPTWPFPHAVMYKYEQALAANGKTKLLSLKEQEPDPDCVAGAEFDFMALLSVPLHVTGEKNPRGVLTFDFSRTNPLGKPEILMAIALANSIASQVPRMQWFTDRAL